MAHEHRTITDSISAASVNGQVHLTMTMLVSGDFFTTSIVIAPSTARTLAAALVEMADDAEPNAPAAVEPA